MWNRSSVWFNILYACLIQKCKVPACTIQSHIQESRHAKQQILLSDALRIWWSKIWLFFLHWIKGFGVHQMEKSIHIFNWKFLLFRHIAVQWNGPAHPNWKRYCSSRRRSKQTPGETRCTPDPNIEKATMYTYRQNCSTCKKKFNRQRNMQNLTTKLTE